MISWKRWVATAVIVVCYIEKCLFGVICVLRTIAIARAIQTHSENGTALALDLEGCAAH